MHLPWQAHLLARTRGHMEMFALHDFDQDGAPELHSASYRKHFPLEVWRFTKSVDGAPMLQPFVLGAEGGGHGYAFGDVNGDGREDVLCEAGWYERPAGDPFAGPWKFHGETALPHPSCPFVVKDLNKDGRLDIIFGRGHDVGLYWWEQQPPRADGTTVWKQHVIDESWTQAHAISLADLDGDGQEELIAGKCIWAHNGGDPGAADPPAIYYYSWNRSTAKFTRRTIAAPGEGIALGRQYSVVDQHDAGFHLIERLGVNQVMRLRLKRAVQDDDVRSGEEMRRLNRWRLITITSWVRHSASGYTPTLARGININTRRVFADNDPAHGVRRRHSCTITCGD